MILISEEISKLTPEELETRKKYALNHGLELSHDRMIQRHEEFKKLYEKSNDEFQKWKAKLELTQDHNKLPWEEEAQ